MAVAYWRNLFRTPFYGADRSVRLPSLLISGIAPLFTRLAPLFMSLPCPGTQPVGPPRALPQRRAEQHGVLHRTSSSEQQP